MPWVSWKSLIRRGSEPRSLKTKFLSLVVERCVSAVSIPRSQSRRRAMSLANRDCRATKATGDAVSLNQLNPER